MRNKQKEYYESIISKQKSEIERKNAENTMLQSRIDCLERIIESYEESINDVHEKNDLIKKEYEDRIEKLSESLSALKEAIGKCKDEQKRYKDLAHSLIKTFRIKTT